MISLLAVMHIGEDRFETGDHVRQGSVDPDEIGIGEEFVDESDLICKVWILIEKAAGGAGRLKWVDLLHPLLKRLAERCCLPWPSVGTRQTGVDPIAGFGRRHGDLTLARPNILELEWAVQDVGESAQLVAEESGAASR